MIAQCNGHWYGMCFIQCRRQRNKRTKSQVTPAMSAGEAIERMLVERKISTKINYDVLRDLANGVAVEGGPSNHHSLPTNAAATSGSLLAISKAPPTTAGRLPSLTTRKRNFSVLMSEQAATTGQPPAKSETRLLQTTLTFMCCKLLCRFGRDSLNSSTTVKDHTDKESMLEHSSDGEIVEESGPVDYCGDEGEGTLEDNDLEQLAYEGDPLLLLSDYEEEEEGNPITGSHTRLT